MKKKNKFTQLIFLLLIYACNSTVPSEEKQNSSEVTVERQNEDVNKTNDSAHNVLHSSDSIFFELIKKEMEGEYNINSEVEAEATLSLFLPPIHSRSNSYKAKTPFKVNQDGKSYKSFTIHYVKYEDDEKAQKAMNMIFNKADPDWGLSYKWDYIIKQEEEIIWLNAGCVYSTDNWTALKSKVKNAFVRKEDENKNSLIIHCRCGGACEKK